MNVELNKKYKAKKGGTVLITILGLLILPIVLVFFEEDKSEIYIFFLVYSLPVALLIWIYFDTSYKIINDKFTYRCAFLRGAVEIGSIKKLEVGFTMYSGIKPALAFKGIIIKYNKYDEIYVAPEDNEELVNDLLSINPTIEIVRKCQ